jgi:hypothetical protein
MSISDSMVDIACLLRKKEKRVAFVALLLLALFRPGFMIAHLRPRSTSHSFHFNTVDDGAYDAFHAPQVRNNLSSYV